VTGAQQQQQQPRAVADGEAILTLLVRHSGPVNMRVPSSDADAAAACFASLDEDEVLVVQSLPDGAGNVSRVSVRVGDLQAVVRATRG
jgi:hypothetical protein